MRIENLTVQEELVQSQADLWDCKGVFNQDEGKASVVITTLALALWKVKRAYNSD